MSLHKLGRLNRTYDSRIPHMSALTAGQTLTPPPPAKDWTREMPAFVGLSSTKSSILYLKAE